jgi:short-subunit dehydrogenase
MQPGRDLALVTGASSGIGAEFARQLAARRIDLVLTARRRDRLEALAAELIAQHPIRVNVIVSDLNEAGGADRLVEELAQRQLAPTILINNAGFGYYSPFVEQSREEIDAMLQVNIRALTILCRRLGEAMAGRRHGYILNVASFAALAPIPRYSVYSGAKAYIVALSQALRHELSRRNVRVSVICPGFTGTEFHDVSRHAKTVLMQATELTPQHVARAGLAGLDRGKLLIVPGWFYKLSGLAGRLLPRAVMSFLSAQIVK